MLLILSFLCLSYVSKLILPAKAPVEPHAPTLFIKLDHTIAAPGPFLAKLIFNNDTRLTKIGKGFHA
jgi:hypothetical protein